MTAKITFTQKEQDQLKKAITEELDPDHYIDLHKLWSKMVAARTKEETKVSGVGVGKVHELARVKFGDRYKTPNTITAAWTIKMQRAITSCGIDEATARRAIDNCDWAGDIWSETLIYNLSKLAVMGTYKPAAQKSFGFTPTKQSGWLGQLED